MDEVPELMDLVLDEDPEVMDLKASESFLAPRHTSESRRTSEKTDPVEVPSGPGNPGSEKKCQEVPEFPRGDDTSGMCFQLFAFSFCLQCCNGICAACGGEGGAFMRCS